MPLFALHQGVGNKQKRTHADIVTKLSGWSEISEEEKEEEKEQEGFGF